MFEEAYGLGCAMINFKHKRKHDDPEKYNPTYAQLSKDMRAYGYDSPNYKVFIKTDLKKRNESHMQVCIGASIHSLIYDQQKNKKNLPKEEILSDYSNNAILWDGIDLKTNYENHPKINAGYFINDNEHNVLDVESKKVNDEKPNEDDKKVCNTLYSTKDNKFKEVKCYSYKYKTTFGIAKTMFVKLTDQFEEAIIHSKREKKDGTYILNQWW